MPVCTEEMEKVEEPPLHPLFEERLHDFYVQGCHRERLAVLLLSRILCVELKHVLSVCGNLVIKCNCKSLN